MLPLVPSADLVKVPLYSFLRLPSFDFLLFTPLMLFKRKKEKKKNHEVEQSSNSSCFISKTFKTLEWVSKSKLGVYITWTLKICLTLACVVDVWPFSSSVCVIDTLIHLSFQANLKKLSLSYTEFTVFFFTEIDDSSM